ncbi:MAG: cytidine deaminase [Gammaproteobacteria bacterium]|nr:cytidine deaminase [Gammaproteobacteria bacterium]
MPQILKEIKSLLNHAQNATAHGQANVSFLIKALLRHLKKNIASSAMNYSNQLTTAVFQKLWIAALRQLPHSYSPYSNFPVTASLLMEDGSLFTGINIENASYSMTLCAEASAIANAISQKHQKITHVLVHAPKLDFCPPCGACRQRINEFSTPNTLIILTNQQGNYKTLTMPELLPCSFNLEAHPSSDQSIG